MSFASDPATTSSRIELLQEYMTGEVLGHDGVVCWSLDSCERSALLDRAGNRRRDVEFAGGQLLHVGHHYDLVEGGQALRILVIAMETGRPDEGVGLVRRRVQVANSAALAMTARNPHMQGVTNALRLAIGRVPGELRVTSPARPREVRVISRRAGDWQTSIREGDTSTVSGTRFWVSVDLAQGMPSYYVAPESWVVDDIHTEHEQYLARNGGRRAQTEDSTHHRIQTSRGRR